MLFATFILGAGAAVLTYYFTSTEPVPLVGRQHFVAVSREREIWLGRRMMEAIRKSAGNTVLHPDSRVARLVTNIGNELAAVADMQDTMEWEFTVIDDDECNAYCLPGGKVVVHTGLIRALEEDTISGDHIVDKLAVVMSHEMSHAIARHHVEQWSRLILLCIPIGIIIMGTSPALPWVYKYFMDLPYSRMLEREADFIGMMLMAGSCYDITLPSRFWAFSSQVLNENRPIDDYLSTHPSNETRSADCENWLPQAHSVRNSMCPESICGRKGEEILKSLDAIASSMEP